MKLSIRRTIKTSLISLAVLGMIGGSITSSNVSAHRRYHIHRQIHRHHHTRRTQYYKLVHQRRHHRHHHSHRSHRRHAYRIRKHHHKHKQQVYRSGGLTAHHSHHESPEVTRNLAELKHQTLIDMNKDRKAHGVKPLKESRRIDRFAHKRAEQLKSGFHHIRGGFNHGDYAENIAESALGGVSFTDGSIRDNQNGYDIANTDEDNMMNHDGGSNHWGHRANILDPRNTKVGIGVSYNPKDPVHCDYKLSEDFI